MKAYAPRVGFLVLALALGTVTNGYSKGVPASVGLVPVTLGQTKEITMRDLKEQCILEPIDRTMPGVKLRDGEERYIVKQKEGGGYAGTIVFLNERLVCLWKNNIDIDENTDTLNVIKSICSLLINAERATGEKGIVESASSSSVHGSNSELRFVFGEYELSVATSEYDLDKPIKVRGRAAFIEERWTLAGTPKINQ